MGNNRRTTKNNNNDKQQQQNDENQLNLTQQNENEPNEEIYDHNRNHLRFEEIENKDNDDEDDGEEEDDEREEKDLERGKKILGTTTTSDEDEVQRVSPISSLVSETGSTACSSSSSSSSSATANCRQHHPLGTLTTNIQNDRGNPATNGVKACSTKKRLDNDQFDQLARLTSESSAQQINSCSTSEGSGEFQKLQHRSQRVLFLEQSQREDKQAVPTHQQDNNNNNKNQVSINMFDLDDQILKSSAFKCNGNEHEEEEASATAAAAAANCRLLPQCDEFGSTAAAASVRSEVKEELNFAKQIGRRISLFSSNLIRSNANNNKQLVGISGNPTSAAAAVAVAAPQQTNRESSCPSQRRRFSLPLPFALLVQRFSSSSSSSVATTSAVEVVNQQQTCVNGPLPHALPPTPSPPLPQTTTTTVAGVGGTVTTVTRKKRKTAPLPRLVAKNGQVNLFFDNIDRRKYFRDLFVTMIDIKWRYNLAAAAFGFVLSWLFFACIWYIVLYFHDDLNHENDSNWSPCIVNVYSFRAALLFSIETQSTLGFGSRIISVECPGAIVIFCTQLIFGVVIECLIVGMVFAKLTRPTKRSQTIMYSKCATICLRENQLCLTFRVGDVRSKSHIIGATIRASLVSQKITSEGEIIPFYHNELNVTIDNSQSLLLIWPVTIVHIIDDKSPFYTLSSQQLNNFKFELITVLEGTVESTGQSIQVRSSYLPSEVKWGYRFEPIVSAHGFGRYAQTIIDYDKFNRLIQVDTPTCSACDYYATQWKQYDQEQQQQQQQQLASS